MPRFSLKWLLVAGAFIGCGVVALLNANLVWFYSLTSVSQPKSTDES